MSTQEKKKLEVFIVRHMYGDTPGFEYEEVTSCKAILNNKEYIQVSEIIEIEFTMKPKGDLTNARLQALDKKIEAAQEVVYELIELKKQLQALEVLNEK